MPVLLIASLAAHAGVLLGLKGDPHALPSLAIPAVSVDLVLGTDRPAGLAAPNQHAEAEADSGDPETTASLDPETLRRERAERAALEFEPVPDELTVETVTPDPAPSAGSAPAPTAPEVTAPEAMPPDPAPPSPDRPVTEPAPKPEPARARTPRPAAKEAREGDRAALKETRTRSRGAASGMGLGQSSADSGYAARVAAHLARYKRFPASALNQGARGTAMVAFHIDGAGRVTSVRLMRGTGSPSLDEEAQAMVRRASPLPPPPSGRAALSLPVTFQPR